MKIALFYSYNGSSFQGSQTQPSGKAIEDALNLALRKVGVFAPVISSSRTDSKVHALMQVSCVEVGDFWDLSKLKNEINRHLPFSIRLKNIKKVSADFHPRYSAKARSYRYILAHGQVNVFLADFVYFCKMPDIFFLNEALKLFCGKRDFSGFYKTGSSEKSPIRELYSARARRFKLKGECFTMIYFKANGFLRSQVRMMVANALLCADNKEKMLILKQRLNTDISSKDSNHTKQTPVPTKIPAPPQALYLNKIYY